jgi:alpha-ribazole phosphatase
MIMEVYLIRHTTVDIKPGLCYGQTDVPLATSFETEAKAVRQKLAQPDDFIVYSSPLSRCRKLAEFLHAGTIRMDQRLMEMHFGIWEQQRWDDIDDKLLKTWMADFVNQQCSDGESYRDVFERVVMFWNELRQQKFDKVLIVTHGGVIRALLTHILDMSLKNAFQIVIDFGSVTKIRELDYEAVIDYVNR